MIYESRTDPARPPRRWYDSPFWPLLVVAGAVLLRFLHVENSQVSPVFWVPTVDPGWYDEAARRIAAGEWGPFPLFRAPLYPALLGAAYSLFGHDLVIARMLNVVLQGLTVLALYIVGRNYFSSAVGLLAALLFAVNGMAIFFCAEILSVNLELLIAVLCLWTLLRLLRTPDAFSILLGGLVWGLAAITRPNFLLLFPLPVLAVWIAVRRHPRPLGFDESRPPWLLRSLLLSIMWLIFAAAPILPVTIANVQRGGEFVLIATQGGVNFWIGNNPDSGGIRSELPGYGPFWTLEDARGFAEQQSGRALSSGEESAFYYRKGWDFLLSRPLQALGFMVRKAALFFNRFEISNNKHIGYFSGFSPWLPRLIYLNLGILLPFALLGLWTGRRTPETRATAAMIAFFALSVALFFVTSRFRMPAVPWLTLLAASGIVWMGRTLRNRFTGISLWPLLILLPGFALAWMNPWNLREAPRGSALYMEGNAYFALGQTENAETLFREALRSDGPADMTNLNLGVIAYRKGDLIAAKSYYEAALAANPRNYSALNNLAVIHQLQGDTLRALSTYIDALKLRPSAPDPRRNLAALYATLGIEALKRENLEQAEIFLTESVNHWPTPSAHYHLAIVYGRSEKPNRAVAELDLALQLDPSFTAAKSLRESFFRPPPTDSTAGGVPAVPDSAR